MKKKVLVSVLACAMLFLGMGYAYWTDSLQVNTSVTTGELDVKFVDLALFGQYPDEEGWAIFDGIDNGYLEDFFFQRDPAAWNNKPMYNIIATEADLLAYKDRIKGYTETYFGAELAGNGKLNKKLGNNDYDETTKASDVINVNVNKMYPGYAQIFRADIVNPGTLAAKLSRLCITTSGTNDSTKNMIGVSFEILREQHGAKVIDLLDGVSADDKFEIGGREFVRLSALGDSCYDVVNNNLLSLYPANESTMDADEWRMDLLFGVAMDPDADGVYTTGSCADLKDNDDGLTQWKNASFKVQFCWDQFNTPAASNNSN